MSLEADTLPEDKIEEIIEINWCVYDLKH